MYILLGTSTGTAIKESSMKVPHKIKNKAIIWSNNPTSKCISIGKRSLSPRDIYISMLIVALFITAKIQK